MTREKKTRSMKGKIKLDKGGPTKTDRLTDPQSYDSRKKKALKDSKKQRSVYQKELDKQKESGADGESGQAPKRGPLADKIRKLNAEKQSD